MDTKKMGRHISRQYNEELENIRNKVLVMGGLVEQQIEMAIKSFNTFDIEIADWVVEQDRKVNDLEKEIDLECNQIIALRQPTAFDLRLLIAVIKIITELERIGDQAKRIANSTIHLADIERPPEKFHELHHLAELVKNMLNSGLDGFARMEVKDVVETKTQDEKVNQEYLSIMRQLITRMMEDPRNIKRVLDVLWIARALERIGAHSCNLCEYLFYMIKGVDVRHLDHAELDKLI